jgi:uncharacterized protein (TIGR02001 family)
MHARFARFAAPLLPGLVALVSVGSSPSHAQSSAPAEWAVSGNLALASDYLFRGLSQTSQDPALQGGVEAAHSSGAYVGAWGSNVSWLSDLSSSTAPVSNSLEFDAYAGWRGALSDQVKFDAGVYTYRYPGDYPHGFTKPDTTELYVGLGWGPAVLKYSYALTDTFGFHDSEGSDYVDLSVNWEFVPSWTLNAHAGHQRISETPDADYSDWKLGLTKAFSAGWSLAVAWFDTNAHRAVYTNPLGEFLGRSTGVATLTKTF